MTVPGISENQPAPGSHEPALNPRGARTGRDKFPILLLVGIFAVVAALTWFIGGENWMTDMTRYNSLKLQGQGKYGEAIEKLEALRAAGAAAGEKYVEFSPTYLSEIGHCYTRLENYDKALEYYTLAQTHKANVPLDDSNNPRQLVDFNYMIGYVQYKQGKLDEAQKTLTEALKIDKLEPLSNFTLGEIAMKKGDYMHAADYFKVVSNNPLYEAQVRKYYAEIEEKLFANIK